MIETTAINTVMRALSDPTRRSLYERLAGAEEMSVVELTRDSGVTQGAVSQHLKTLKLAGLVLERRKAATPITACGRKDFSPCSTG